MKNSLLIILSLLLSQLSFAERLYISDQLYVPLRGGMGTQYRILHRGLASGTVVTLIEQNQEEGWSHVELEDGTQGWIRNQYLLTEPTAQQQLAGAEQQVKDLEARRKQLLNQVKQLSKENKELGQSLKQQSRSAQDFSSELDNLKLISADAVDLHQRHQKLLEEHQLLQTHADVLKAKQERLEKDKRRNEWLTGGFILLLGMIATLLAQSMKGRKRNSEWA